MPHTHSNLLVHVIFSTKNHAPFVREAFRERLYEYMGGLAAREFGRALIVGGTGDHVHGLLSLRPNISLSDAMMKWKSLSSGWVHRTFASESAFAWQNGYAAFSVSHSMAPRVRRYIEGQEEHHRKHSFSDELLAFLDAHGVEYNPQYIGGH